jgi:hypothetical protein
MYRRVEIPNRNTRSMSELLADWFNGEEVGSLAYVRQSPYRFIRTKAIQAGSALSQFKGEAVGYITPRAYHNAIVKNPNRAVQDGDIIYARAGNVGEVAIAEGCGQAIPSGHVLKIILREKKWYVFAFMKHDICKLQQRTQQTGAIKALDNFKIEQLLACKVPFPDQTDGERVERYVSVLMEAIAQKERAIRDRNDTILKVISDELAVGQTKRPFVYTYPSLSEVRDQARFDAAIYSRECKSKMWLINNYARGCDTPTAAGFTVTPGPSLEIKILRTRIDSDTSKPGFYTLLIPANISEYGTMSTVTWLGTAKKLPQLRQGDILFGEAGFGKGRTIVLIDAMERVTTNAHGLYARRSDDDLTESIFFRCIFHWYRNMRLIDLMAVGGSGGHFSPEYFDSLLIPRFSDSLKSQIVKLYHSPSAGAAKPPNLTGFVDYHQARNHALGIWELDRDMKTLKSELAVAQELIIQGKTVTVALPD